MNRVERPLMFQLAPGPKKLSARRLAVYSLTLIDSIEMRGHRVYQTFIVSMGRDNACFNVVSVECC